MSFKGKWRDTRCTDNVITYKSVGTHNISFICKKGPSTTTSTTTTTSTKTTTTTTTISTMTTSTSTTTGTISDENQAIQLSSNNYKMINNPAIPISVGVTIPVVVIIVIIIVAIVIKRRRNLRPRSQPSRDNISDPQQIINNTPLDNSAEEAAEDGRRPGGVHGNDNDAGNSGTEHVYVNYSNNENSTTVVQPEHEGEYTTLSGDRFIPNDDNSNYVSLVREG
ncbi:hypothetical protein LSH36_2203g00012 [Paralvinella palmiformis]|uniref:Uncharacterized protein n=1 Tax=Paralvinella palmiformis TaxID=53620 RepID=A0AAD9IRB4_9ANNE|nr:hypothetical protein LSH36_2203g00012 [Paralvinella palmiformis]